MTNLQKQIYYSEKYCDENYEYRHVVLPKEIAKLVPKNKLMSESEWRGIGVQQSQGWIHYMKHDPGKKVSLADPLLLNDELDPCRIRHYNPLRKKDVAEMKNQCLLFKI